jgi:hypothetical protein
VVARVEAVPEEAVRVEVGLVVAARAEVWVLPA